LRRLGLSVALLILLNLLGTLLYMGLEGWNFIDSLYMTVITIATVGFGEVRDLSPEGRLATIILIYLGVGLATTAVSNAVSLALGPLLWSSLQQRRMRSMIDKMKDHYIVCGYGRMGAQIVRDLRMRDEPFVVVDTNPEIESILQEENIPYILDDATEDEVLQAAGVERARGVVAALGSDPANLMTVLTAREMNPRLFIVARVVRPESESKLRRAGANRVINPYQIGGHRITLSLLRPAVHDFLDHIFHFGEGREIDIGQIHVSPGSVYDGKTIAESRLRDEHNVNILAIREPSGHISITPNPSSVIEPHAELIIIGPPKAIYSLERQHLKD
ncbi:MAG: NAD-binding protein, partial [Anaerolineae bacterium]|nr:NAD-binding protein [Anaerolineae bacterium]